MTESRKLIVKAAVVVALATLSLSRPRVVAAESAVAVGCTPFQCSEAGEDCYDVWLSINCSTCGGDAYPVCSPNLWECAGDRVYFGCGFAS